MFHLIVLWSYHIMGTDTSIVKISNMSYLLRTRFSTGFMRGVSTLCTCFMCVPRTVPDLYPLPQTAHLYGRSPVCSRSWTTSDARLLTILPQKPHLKLGPACLAMCFLSPELRAHWYSHSSHWNLVYTQIAHLADICAPISVSICR